MKTNNFNYYGLRIMMILAIAAMFSCHPEEPVKPIIPVEKPIVVLKEVSNMRISTVTFNAEVTGNEDGARVWFQYATNAMANVGNWNTDSLDGTLSGSSMTVVSLDVTHLKEGETYNLRVGCKNSAGSTLSDTKKFSLYAVADADGNLYHIVKIGDQVWLQENLKTTHYANGDPIDYVTDFATWGSKTGGAYCFYNFDSKNGATYGAMYNWYTTVDSRKLIQGWHVPSENDWGKLTDFLGGVSNNSKESIAGPKVIDASGKHWIGLKKTVSNSSGFTALPGGLLLHDYSTKVSSFLGIKEGAGFWSTAVYGDGALSVTIVNDNCALVTGHTFPFIDGLELRLVKD